MVGSLRWFSPLGISVLMFLAIGALWLLIGILTVPLLRSTDASYLFISKRTDTAFFGQPPADLLKADPALAKFRTLLLTVLSGCLLLAGAAFICLAWFGLRQGQAWALAALGVSGLLAVAWWALALLPYVRAGIRLTLGDLPPFMWLPAGLILPALVLGWIGLR